MENESRIRKVQTSTPVTVDDVYVSDYQKDGTKTAQLRQVVTTKAYYPSKQITNSHSDNPFQLSDFGFEETEFESVESRVAWVDVPESASKDDVEGKLSPESTLYRILSNRPIITDSQEHAISSPEIELTLDDIANKQVVRYPKGHAQEGQIILDLNGKPQYRAVFFSATAREDEDTRNAVADDFYITDEIRAELHGASAVVNQQM